MDPLDLTGLSPLMEVTSGIHEISVGLIDGPVAESHPDLTCENLWELPGRTCSCIDPGSISCRHGTFIAGILNAKRSSPAPAICPGCTLLIRPVFLDSDSSPESTPAEVASAINDCIREGIRIINLSVVLEGPSTEGDDILKGALDCAAQKGVIVVAAGGNQGAVGGSVLTRHPWVIPVAACDLHGRLLPYNNHGRIFLRKGLAAPGEKITSLNSDGQWMKFCGTSIAAPFVTGAIALLWSASPRSNAREIKSALSIDPVLRRSSRVLPLLNASEAYRALRGIGLPPSRKRMNGKAA